MAKDITVEKETEIKEEKQLMQYARKKAKKELPLKNEGGGFFKDNKVIVLNNERLNKQ